MHLLTFAHPYFLLTVVLDVFNFFSSGPNQRLTTSVQLEVYVILVWNLGKYALSFSASQKVAQHRRILPVESQKIGNNGIDTGS